LFSNVKDFEDLPFLSMIVGFDDNVIYDVLNITPSDSKVDFTNNEITFNIWNGLPKNILENQPPMLKKLMKRIMRGNFYATDEVIIEALNPYFNVTQLKANGKVPHAVIIERIIIPYIKASNIHHHVFKKDSVFRNDKGEINYGDKNTIDAINSIKEKMEAYRNFAAYMETGLPSWMVVKPNDYYPLTEIATYADYQEYAQKVKTGGKLFD